MDKTKSGFSKGDRVVLLDYPFGKPLRVSGRIVGVFPDSYYNVLVENGCNEGKIIKYKYWFIKLWNLQ